VVAKRLESSYRPGLRSKSWTKTKHFQTRNFALLGWLPPEEWRQDRGCVVLGLRSEAGIEVAGVVESGYGRDLVQQLPALTRRQLRSLQQPGQVWEGSEPLIGEVRYLEWSPAGGLRHASLTRKG
jgi:bifunctional non-homologous end joining protein LigD